MKIQGEKAGFASGVSEYDRCIAILKREIELVTRIGALQSSVRTAVLNRQWTDFEARLGALGEIGGEFEILDRERLQVFAALTENQDTPEDSGEEFNFYALISRFPGAERGIISETYRNLKLETVKVRLGSEAIMTYLNEARLLLTGFLEAAFPERKGRLYSRSGVQIPADMRSMVLNQQF
jgi:hypothetical protein